MTPPRPSKPETPPKKAPAKPTTYEISMRTSAQAPAAPTYQIQGRVEATSAAKAIREWCTQRGEQLNPGLYRAVPTTMITELDVAVEVKRQLTLGAPAS